jgi:hypothetical protein
MVAQFSISYNVGARIGKYDMIPLRQSGIVSSCSGVVIEWEVPPKNNGTSSTTLP